MSDPNSRGGRRRAWLSPWRLGRFALTLVFAFSTSTFAASEVPTFTSFRAKMRSSEGQLLDRYGEVLHELRTDPQGRRLEWTPLEEISPLLRTFLIATEDRNFDEHSGVDWIALAAGGVRSLFGKGRGASTISMQVAAQIDPYLLPKGGRRGVLQKLDQVRVALELEKQWTKAQIQETYLNQVHYRGELQGIRSAAQGLFGKSPHGLDSAEALLLVSLIQNPNVTAKRLRERACGLSTQLELGVSCPEVERSVAQRFLRPYFVAPSRALAPHLARQLLKASGAAKIRSTLERDLQSFVNTTLRSHVGELKGSHVEDGAAVVIENKSGAVRAYVGGVGEVSRARFVDLARASRQAGSTLKPFLYADAIEDQIISASTVLDDVPHQIAVLGGIYEPRNFDEHFQGPVPAHVALASSLNVPAVKLLEKVGVKNFIQTLKAFGLTNLRAPEVYGPSLALGSADVTLWELTNAYRTLANGGRYSLPHLLAGGGSAKTRKALDARASFVVGDILSQRDSRSTTFGLENPLSTRSWTAVKTGTSKDMRDNWCIGFSERYTVGVWVGNAGGSPMWNVSGVSGAAPVWSEIMNHLHHEKPSRAPKAPATLVQVGGQWHLPHTEHLKTETAVAGLPSRIVYPLDGLVVALDPDIPPSHQRIYFQVENARPGDQLRLDDSIVELVPLKGENGKLEAGWSPKTAGRYSLQLVRGKSQVIDSTTFDVRGKY